MDYTHAQIQQTLAATYDNMAAAYESAVVPVFRPIAKRLLQFIDLRPGWQVLDAGTGTGLVAVLGAPRVGKGGRIVGVDRSPQMLEIGRQKAARFGFTQCEFVLGDLEALEFPALQFNACLSQFALHHTEPEKALQELCRVLALGGVLIAHEWAEAPDTQVRRTPHQVMFDVLSIYRATEAEGALAIARVQSERASAFRRTIAKPDVIQKLAKEAGFKSSEAHTDKIHVRVADVDAFLDLAAASPLLYTEIATLSAENRTKMLGEARKALQEFETANGFEWDYDVLALIAHK